MPITSDWPLPSEGIRFLTPRSIVEELASNPLTQGLYPVAMGYYPAARGHAMRRQSLSNYLMIYCTDGEGTLTVDKKRCSIRSGDLILLPRNQPHNYQASIKNPWTIYWLHFDGLLADAFYQHTQLNMPCINIGVQPRVVRIFDGLSELRRGAYQLAEFVQGCHQLQALLSYIALLVRQQKPQTSKALDGERLRAIMQEHVHGQLNLDALAAEAKLSKYHFSKKFKAQTGESPIQYFINMKIQRACYLLDSTSQPVKQIAAALGYDDAYYFSRLFKKNIGLSPREYRQHRRT